MISPAQCRAARALLNWSQQQLAEAANVGNATIRNFEGSRNQAGPQRATLQVLQTALEREGVVFFDTAEEFTTPGPGVCLRAR